MSVNNNSDLNNFQQLVRFLNLIPRKKSTLLVGIDGSGGSGKSILAHKLKDECANVTVVWIIFIYHPGN